LFDQKKWIERKDAMLNRVHVQVVGKGLVKGIPPLVHDYTKKVLQKMKKEIQVAVQTAITDSMTPSWPPVSDSVVLSQQQENYICSWVGDQKEHSVKLELLYRASKDGWQGKAFHSRCDAQGATLTVIKSYGSEVFGSSVFGGYADVAWNSEGGCIGDPHAFLFAMKVNGHPVKMTLSTPDEALSCSPEDGPTFGVGKDIHVYGNTNRVSTNIQLDQLPPGVTLESNITGCGTCQVQEVEVFRVVRSDIDRFSRVVPLETFNQVFKIKPDMEGPLMRLCDHYLQEDTSFWVKGFQELFTNDIDKVVYESAHPDFLRCPPLLLAKRFGGLEAPEGVIGKLTDRHEMFQEQIVRTQIREAVSESVQRFNSEIASVKEWPKTLTLNGVIVDVVKTDRVTALANEIVLSFLHFNTEMLEGVHQRVHALVGQAKLIENETCACERRKIMNSIMQVKRAQDGIIDLLVEHKQERQESVLAAPVWRVGTCVVVIKSYGSVPKGSVGKVCRNSSTLWRPPHRPLRNFHNETYMYCMISNRNIRLNRTEAAQYLHILTQPA